MCVILVTFITTAMVSLVAIVVWLTPWPFVLLGLFVFGLLDGLYLSSALTKVPDGAWFTLALGAVLSSIFVLWRYGKENQWRAESADRLPLSQLFAKEDQSKHSIVMPSTFQSHPRRDAEHEIPLQTRSSTHPMRLTVPPATSIHVLQWL